MISWVGDWLFISTVTSIAPRIIKSGNSQISFFMVFIEEVCRKRRQDGKTEWQRIGNQIDAAMIFAWTDFVSVL